MKKVEVLKLTTIVKKYVEHQGVCDVICHEPEKITRGNYQVVVESKMWLSSVLLARLSWFMDTRNYRVIIWTDGEKILMSIE